MRTKFLATTAVASTLLLAACGGGDDDASSAPTLSGTAAVGTPIVGGSVKVSCAGGSALNTTTSSNGGWQVTTSGQTLPCAVQVSGGTIGGSANSTPYHSMALNFGTVNITPLTDLVIARLSNQAPSTWFNGLTTNQLQSVTTTSLNAALNNVQTTLGLSSTLNGNNPLTTRFQAVNGNLMDDVLEALKTALSNAGLNYNALLALASQNTFSAPSGFDFASAYQNVTDGGGSATTCASGETAMTFAASTSVSSPYSNNQQVCFTASSTQLKFSGKTLSSPTTNPNVTAPFAAYTFVDGIQSYEVVLNNGKLYEINLSVNGTYAGQFAGDNTSGGGGTPNQAGLTFSQSLGGITSFADAMGTTTSSTNTTSNVTTHKTEWGNALSSVVIIVQHSIVPNYLGASYESLTVNVAKASPIISAQLANSSGGVCMLSWNGSTMPSSYKLCSALGINYNRITGAITFNNTPLNSMVGSPSAFTLNGGLSFTAY